MIHRLRLSAPMLWVFLALLLSAFGSPALAEDICQLPNVDTFLEKCPTNDPALGRILTDFTIKRDGVPVVFGPASCVEPISTLPLAQYTDELMLLQTLRTIYYLDRDRCGHLPWTPLSLYQWLRSKVGGFNIDSTATSNSCCGVWPDGRAYITLNPANDATRDFCRAWEGIAERIAMVMHEGRHRDGFPHVGCCAKGPGGCDNTYDETNLSPYGIQYWLERAWLDGTLHTGYTCLSSTRTSAIKSWLRGTANGRVGDFCTGAPPLLTDTNNPAPACDQRCATNVSCIAPAWGIPPSGGPPRWWSTSPPEPVYHDRLDDPRWAGASKITYGDGTGEKAELRALHKAGYFYLSWRALVAPASTPSQNVLYLGYRKAGGGDVIVTASLNALTATSASASQLTLQAFVRNPDGSLGAASTLPPEIPATARVWVDPAAPGSWAVQLQLPIAALQMTCGRVQLWYQLLAGTPTAPVASFTWPRSGADVDGGTAASPHAPIFPDPALWNWLRPSTGTGDERCATAGVSLAYDAIGTTNTPASQIQYRAAAPFPNNTLFARPTNHSGGTIPAGAMTATFRLANWGSVPGDWEQGVPVDQLWAPIPGGSNVPSSGPLLDGATADAASGMHFDWTVADPDLAQFVSGARRSHQCMLVELKSATAPGLTFTNSSVYRNMDLVSASSFRRAALLSVKGLAPAPAGARDLYVYVETRDMPERAKPGPGPATEPGSLARRANRAEPTAALPTYRVHVYHDTGKVLSLGGTTRPILRYQTSFGYEVTHQGQLEGWRHEIEGSGLVKLAENWYRIPVPNDGAVEVTTTIEAVEPGSADPWSLSLHAGANLPLGQSRNLYDGGPGGGIDLEYMASSSFGLEAFLGLDGLRGKAGIPNVRVTQLYLSGKAYLLPGTLRPIVLAGAGAYGLDPGPWKPGFHAGLGLQLGLSPHLAVETTAKVHDVPDTTPALQFVTLQAGVRVRF